MAGEPGGRSVAAAWESAPAAAACGGLSVAALSSVPGSLATASVAVGRWSFLALVGGPVVVLASSATFSGGLAVESVSAASGGLSVAALSSVPGELTTASVVVGRWSFLALAGGPVAAPLGGSLVALGSSPPSPGGLAVDRVSKASDGLALAAAAESDRMTLAAAVVVGGCVFLALVGGPSVPLAAGRLAAVCPPLRIIAALPRV